MKGAWKNKEHYKSSPSLLLFSLSLIACEVTSAALVGIGDLVSMGRLGPVFTGLGWGGYC